MNDKILQDLNVLNDTSSTGRKRPWEIHKMANELLAAAYESIHPDKARRLSACATELSFAWDESEQRHRLRYAWFCRVRLCPMCSWRRSLKVGAQMHAIMNAIREDRPCAYLFLTLTVKNCEGEQLNDHLNRIIGGFHGMMRRKRIKDATLGWYRSVEITHNLQDDTFHPHIHAVVAVDPRYFKEKSYIAQDEWTSLWQHAIGADYTPIVDVRRIKGNTAAAVAEVAKYAVKSSDYIIPDDWDLTVETVQLLDAVLHNRRFIAFSGIFKDYHKKLHLDDADQGNLVNVEADPLTPDTDEHLTHFVWYSGYRQYCEKPLI